MELKQLKLWSVNNLNLTEIVCNIFKIGFQITNFINVK
jgi:hypothetical protein